MSKPSLANGNILLATEEDYEQTDCALAGSFQTWWIKRLDGTRSAIVPLDKVELADLGSYPLPVGGLCSSHWFDYRPGGLVAVGFYGGGTQILDVRNPKEIKPYAHSAGGVSEVWDAMWMPVDQNRRQTGPAPTSSTRSTWSVGSTSTPSTSPATTAAPSRPPRAPAPRLNPGTTMGPTRSSPVGRSVREPPRRVAGVGGSARRAGRPSRRPARRVCVDRRTRRALPAASARRDDPGRGVPQIRVERKVG